MQPWGAILPSGIGQDRRAQRAIQALQATTATGPVGHSCLLSHGTILLNAYVYTARRDRSAACVGSRSGARWCGPRSGSGRGRAASQTARLTAAEGTLAARAAHERFDRLTNRLTRG